MTISVVSVALSNLLQGIGSRMGQPWELNVCIGFHRNIMGMIKEEINTNGNWCFGWCPLVLGGTLASNCEDFTKNQGDLTRSKLNEVN